MPNGFVPFGQEGDRHGFSPDNMPPNPSTLNVMRGRKRRVSESTPGWHPDPKKKRPASEGDMGTARALHFSPYVAPPEPLPRREERSLERV